MGGRCPLQSVSAIPRASVDGRQLLPVASPRALHLAMTSDGDPEHALLLPRMLSNSAGNPQSHRSIGACSPRGAASLRCRAHRRRSAGDGAGPEGGEPRASCCSGVLLEVSLLHRGVSRSWSEGGGSLTESNRSPCSIPSDASYPYREHVPWGVAVKVCSPLRGSSG